jgi:hypothetical protein
MSDARIQAFVGGVVGGFAAVGVTSIALQAAEVYQRRQAQRMQPGFAGMGGDGS